MIFGTESPAAGTHFSISSIFGGFPEGNLELQRQRIGYNRIVVLIVQ